MMFVIIASLNTILGISYYLNFPISLQFVQSMLILELFLSFAIIISGLLIGRIKNPWLYYIIPAVIISLFIFIFFYFNWSYNQPFITYAKLSYLLIWVILSSISLFFLTLYFFTSFSKKVIALGMPKDHIFFGYVIKIVIFISILIYIYIIFELTLGSVILGTFGIITSLIVLLLIKRAPKKVDSVPGIINFATAVGFFNIFMFYHIIVSFSSTSRTVVSLIIDILMLLVVVLYLIQSLTHRISESPSRLKQSGIPVRFQSRFYFTDKMKRVFGERGVVLMVIGLALGYHMVILDSFFKVNIPIIPALFSPNIELLAIYHRIYLIFSFFIIILAIITFKSSKRFREFMVNKYTIRQVFSYIGSYFTRPEEGSSPFELGVQALGKKVGDRIKKWQDSVQKILKGMDEQEEEES